MNWFGYLPCGCFCLKPDQAGRTIVLKACLDHGMAEIMFRPIVDLDETNLDPKAWRESIAGWREVDNCLVDDFATSVGGIIAEVTAKVKYGHKLKKLKELLS